MKKRIFAIVICFVFFFGMVGLLCLMNSLDKQTEETTVELSITISAITVSETEKKTNIKIITEEYENDFYLQPNITKYLDDIEISTLKKGDKIEIRLRKEDVELLNKAKFIYLLSVTIGEKDLISLEEYNDYMNISAKPARISCVILALVFFVFMVGNIKNLIKGTSS